MEPKTYVDFAKYMNTIGKIYALETITSFRFNEGVRIFNSRIRKILNAVRSFDKLNVNHEMLDKVLSEYVRAAYQEFHKFEVKTWN